MSGALNLTYIFDFVISVLLVTTIVYAVILNRKLAALRDAKAEMEALVARFADAMTKAESGIEALKHHAQRSGETLQRKLDAAQGMADDLAFLIERGNRLAQRLEGAPGETRTKAPAGVAPGGTGTKAPAGVASGPSPRVPPDAAVATAPRPKEQSDAAVMTTPRPKEQAGAKGASSGASSGPDADQLSPHEAELLKALQGMR